MLERHVYINRREELRRYCKGGLLFLPGNNESPMNYSDNTYNFRQDSNFLYFFGIDKPGLAGIIDLDGDNDVLYGNNVDLDDIIWTGERPSIAEYAFKAGINQTGTLTMLYSDLTAAIKRGRKIKILPTYQCQQRVYISDLLNVKAEKLINFISDECIKAIISLRERKDDNEIKEIEYAVDIAYKMHTAMMRMSFPGTWEREIAGAIEGIALSHGVSLSFPVILSMDGQTLHNHYHGNLLVEGRMVVTDAGCESPLHYASDITRTVPVGGKFSSKQKDIYDIVLAANLDTIQKVKPEIFNRDLHFNAARIISEGLKDLGLMKGDIDEAVVKGAYALFFPHGIGHMLGLDAHDMESLGEDNVGYDESIARSSQFGLSFLRLAKKLKSGFVITIEPGIYFIPALIDKWKSNKKFTEFINYDKLESYRDFGGIRIEDDILVTQSSFRVLGTPIPKTVNEIERCMAGQC